MGLLKYSLCISLSGTELQRPSEQITRRPSVLLSFLATCSPGLEAVVARELQSPAVGAFNVKVGNTTTTRYGSVHFHGDWEVCFNAILWLRSGARVLHLLSVAELNWSQSDPLYEFVKNAVEWGRFLGDSRHPARLRSFSVESSVRDCARNSSALYAAPRAEAAIREALQESGRKVAEVTCDGNMSEVPLLLCLHKDKAMLYRDMTGVSLDKRDYMKSSETLERDSLSSGVAAGILTIAGWNSLVPGFGENKSTFNSTLTTSVLMDPMCGCGTFLIEAALMSCNMAPGLLRTNWPFMSWHDFDEELWQKCSFRASGAALSPPSELRLLGNDSNEAALSLCAQRAERAKVKHLLHLSCRELEEYTPPGRPALVAVNPPWGERLYTTEKRSLLHTYLTLGRFLKSCCNESDVYMLSGSRELAKKLKMKPAERWPLTVEGLEFMLLHFYVWPSVVTTESSDQPRARHEVGSQK